jgi:hypothetical protein
MYNLSESGSRFKGGGSPELPPFLFLGEVMSYSSYLKNFGRVVSFSPGLANIIGRNEALFLAQLLFWTDVIERTEPTREGWIFKNSPEIERETSLSYKEQFTARTHLRELDLIEEDPKPLDHLIYFRVKQKNLDALIERQMEDSGTPLERTSIIPKGVPENTLKAFPTSIEDLRDDITEKTGIAPELLQAQEREKQERERREAKRGNRKGKLTYQRASTQNREVTKFETPTERGIRDSEQARAVFIRRVREEGGT